MNQEQVNGQGVRVGINRPDLQFTLPVNGKPVRHYIEFDTRTSDRGPLHEQRIRANDPNGKIILLNIGGY